jgi:1,2-phenylacetyl-CoA epoxidase catalytic subunit
VVDRYATSLAHYREIACIVRGAHATTVVVGAARLRDWTRLAPQLKRAVASFAT